MSTKLFEGSDGSDNDDLQLGTNKDYAKSYNNFRKKELLKKFKDRGLDVSESDSSSDSESSEEDEALDPKFDREFFKTLSKLKSKDPAIYDKNTRFFEGVKALGKSLDDDDDGEDDGDDQDVSRKKDTKAKPVTLKDYERKIILERGGKFEDDSDAEVEESNPFRSHSPTFVEEEQRLKEEFQKVMNADDSAEEEEFGGIFKKREKTIAERNQEEADFAEWLGGKKEDIETDVKQQLEPLKNYWSSNKLPQSERFLRDYVLNKGYATTQLDEIPTYDEIVGDNAPLSEDEEELEKQAEFEQKYNFRFEEPDAEFIQRFPRTIESSVRRTDDKRKQKRQELKQRKVEEKEQKMKEFEIIKKMKCKEIEEKINKLKMVTGNEELGFKDEELEEDFDPDAHDRRMQEIFNDDYYQVDEGEEKPECPSDIDELKFEDWDNYDPASGRQGEDGLEFDGHCEDDDFNMDCEYDPAAAKQQLQQELIDSTRGRKGRKGRRNRFMEMIQADKPPFNPDDEKTYGEYIDEYYKMDCEDIIGDIPCRFKYVETTPNDFGLTIEEILLAKNKELNQWASLKKAIQIRPDVVEKKEQRLYKMKAKNEELKRKIFKSLYGEGSDDDEEEESSMPLKTEEILTESKEEENGKETETETAPPSAKKSKKKRKRKAPVTATVTSSNGVANAQPQEVENAVSLAKKPKFDEGSSDQKPAPPTTEGVSAAPEKKKKRRQKKKKAVNTGGENTLNPGKAQNPQPATAPTAQKAKQNKKPQNAAQKSQANAKKNPFSNKFKSESGGQQLVGGSLPPLRKNSAGGGKFKPKFNKSNNKPSHGNDKDAKISDERLKAYGINPRKFHKKEKYGNKPK